MAYLKSCNRLAIKHILNTGEQLIDTEIIVGGWVKTGRPANKNEFLFVELNDGSTLKNLQVIITSTIYNIDEIKSTGTCLLIKGIIKKSPDTANIQSIELHATEILHVGSTNPQKYPISKKKITMEFLRDKLHLRSRTNTIAAIARIRNTLSYATHKFFQDNGFLYVHTPLITTSDCEGAGEMFQVTTLLDKKMDTYINKNGTIDYTKDFFGKPAYLTVSGQMQGEMYACSLTNIYTFGPTFRAENSHTSRHLAEFWMIEPELAFATLDDIMSCSEAYIKYCCKEVFNKCKDDLEFINKMYDKECLDRLQNIINEPFVKITYDTAVELLLEEIKKGQKFEYSVKWGEDLKSEHERFITEKIYKKPVIVYNYPKDIKAFYMKMNQDKKTVAAMDLLVPKVGELIGGSQREERLDLIESRMSELNLKPDEYEQYLDLRRYGSAPHSGFGLGFERLILLVTGIDNIRDVIPFPRWAGNCQ